MKRFTKIASVILAVCLVASLAACGGAAGVDQTYKVTYDNTVDPTILESVPAYQFNAANLNYMIPYGMNLDVILDLDEDSTYTLTAKWYNIDTNAVEGDPGYLDVHVEAEGTYTIEGDKVTISDATSATAVYNGGAYITEQGMFALFSFGADGGTGSWTSTDVPEILACVPATVFTVTEDGAIVTWAPVDASKAGNPHDAAPSGTPDEQPAEDTTAPTEAPTEPEAPVAGSFAFDCEWVCTMVLNPDGTYKFDLADYNIVEEGTWAYADGVLTVTKPSGNTCVSTVDGETLNLAYVADASEQLVGNFYSTNWKDFFESAAPAAPAGDAISLSCDWVCTMVLNPDGTYNFDLADYNISEAGTWTYADGVLTVTKPSGNTCVSYVEEGVLHLDYVADASEQLVGQFYCAEWETLFN